VTRRTLSFAVTDYITFMFKRITLFIAAHIAFFAVAAAIVAASTTGADAQQSDNPYDMRFTVEQAVPMVAGPDAGSATIGEVAAGTRDIVLRWCRPEFPVTQWMFGSRRVQQNLLNERVCEVQAAGAIGFVPGAALRVQ
jgi:hypothetical protein